MESSAKKPDAQPQGSGGEDLSMEEILQSIRKIIAEEGDDAAAKPAVQAPPADVPGSDVLELTDVVKDDGSIVNIAQASAPPPQPASAPVAPPPPAAPAATSDVLAQIDEALAPAKPSTVQLTEEHLLADQSSAVASEAFRKLEAAAEPALPPLQVTPSPTFKSGITVEDMVAAMLKPMMKEWLDANLPAIVERLVENEVRRLSKG